MANDPASGGGDPDSATGSHDPAHDRVVELDSRVGELRAAIATLDDEVDELIRDVRERVIQVKREADEKAPHDHDHPDLAEAIERVEADLAALATDLDASNETLAERIELVDDRTTRGFSNFEDVLEYLIETTDGLTDTLERVASATLDLRERTARLSEAEARRAAADRLRMAANEYGVSGAKCETCGGTVDLRLLSLPECPHCGEGFTELEPRRGLFRSSRLRTGERPALEGEVAEAPPDLSSIVADEGPAPPPAVEYEEPPTRATSATDEGAEPAERPIEEAEPSAPGTDLDVDEVSGVGPTYAGKLRAAGVETAGDLALSDPERLAEAADIDRGRVEILIRRARDAVGAG